MSKIDMNEDHGVYPLELKLKMLENKVTQMSENTELSEIKKDIKLIKSKLNELITEVNKL